MKKISVVFILVLLAITGFSQGHSLEFKIKGMKDSVVILGYYNGDKLSVQDSIQLSATGVGKTQGSTALPRGKYFLYLTSSKRFDFLLGDDQNFTIEADTSDLVNSIKVIGSVENELFHGYIQFIQSKIKRRGELEEKHKASTSDAEKKQIVAELSDMNKVVKGYMDTKISENPNSFFAKQMRAGFEVEFPEAIRKRNDRDEMYRYYVAHYFDNIDFSEDGMARTAVFPKKLDEFLGKYIPQIPDSIIPKVTMLLEKSKQSTEMYKFMIMHIHDYFVTSENLELENVYVWYLDNYFLKEATWMGADFLKRVGEKSVKMKPLLIGAKAPNVEADLYDSVMHDLFSTLIGLSRTGDEADKNIKEKKDVAKWTKRKAEVTDSLNTINSKVSTHPRRKRKALYDINAKYTILAFWEPDCSHCKKSMPELNKKYPELKKKNIEVYAFCTQLKPGVWGEFIEKNDMNHWLNVWDPYNTSKFRDKYEIHSTPMIFILDKDKKILLKKVAVEHLDEAIEYLDKRYSEAK